MQGSRNETTTAAELRVSYAIKDMQL